MRCRCPVCQSHLNAIDILLALDPSRIRCAQCRTRLVGDRFIKRQHLVVLLVGVVCGSLVAVGLRVHGASIVGMGLSLLGFVLCFAVLMAQLTLRYGSYTARESA